MIKISVNGKVYKREKGFFIESLIKEAEGISMPCGGHGKCGKCKVYVKGNVNPLTENEKRLLSKVLSDYFAVCLDRMKMTEKITAAVKNGFITGSGIIYTYWDAFLDDGNGDIVCEVLPVENIYFGDEKEENVEKQPFIIIASRLPLNEVKETAKKYGSASDRIKSDFNDGKVLVLTKLYKQNGKVMAVSVTEKEIVRKEYNTFLNRYPISLFSWDKKLMQGDLMGEQIAVAIFSLTLSLTRY
jgi:ferredoxin